MKDSNTRIILFNGKKIKQVKGPDDIWRDEDNTEYGYIDAGYYTDEKTRAGVGALSLPEEDPLSKAAATHDFAYSSPAYQKYHTREEADKMLEKSIEALPGWRKLMAKPFYGIVRLFGSRFWENKKTDK